MKRDRRNMLRRCLPAALAAAALVLGGAFLWKYHQAGALFQPSAQTRALQENQLVFPGQEETLAQNDQEDTESKLLQKDRGAENAAEAEDQVQAEVPENDPVEPVDNPMASPEPSAQMDQPNQWDAPEESSAPIRPDGSTQTGGNGDAEVTAAPGQNGGTVIVPGEEGDPNGPQVKPSPSASVEPKPSPSSSPSPSEHPSPSPEPSSSPSPVPSPVPSPEPSPVPDPEPVVPDDPMQGDILFDSSDFPDETGVSTGQTAAPEQFELLVQGKEMYPDSGFYCFYQGETVTPEKILAAAAYYLHPTSVDQITKLYRFTSFGDCFRLDSYPPVAEGDSFTVQLSFRPNSHSSWQSAEYTIAVEQQKLMLLRYGDQRPIELFLAPGESVDLSCYYAAAVPETAKEESLDGWLPLTQLHMVFPGWSETEGGEIVGPVYTVTKPGRTVLYPGQLQVVPAGCQVLDLGGIQTLTDVPEGGNVAVPMGITAVSIFSVPDRLVLPASVTSAEGVCVQSSFSVDEENPRYSVRDGLLCNKEQTVIESVPLRRTQLTVPSQVTEVHLSSDQTIRSIAFTSQEPPEVENLMRNIFNCLPDQVVLYVPQDSAPWYFSRWAETGARMCAAETGEELAYIKKDGMVLSPDGTILYCVDEETGGLLQIPDSVKVIKAGALDRCAQLKSLYLPSDGLVLEEGSLAAPNLAYVLVQAASAPEGLEKALGPDSQAEVEIEGQFHRQDGYTWLEQDGTITLLAAPCSAAEFYGVLPGGIAVNVIGPHAFADCASLRYVELPGSVVEIGEGAFQNCTALEGVYAAASSLTVGTGAFDGCYGLKFVALDAEQLAMEDSPSWASCCHVRYDAAAGQPWESFVSGWLRVEVQSQGGGYILYGWDPLGDSAGTTAKSMITGTSGVSGELVMDAETVDIRDSAFAGNSGITSLRIETSLFRDGSLWGIIGAYAFYDCYNLTSITFSEDCSVWNFGYYAFYGTGIRELTLPASVQNMDAAFSCCTSLEMVDLRQAEDLVSIGEDAFCNCSSLTQVYFPPNLSYIGSGAFYNTALSQVTLPATVTGLGVAAFSGTGAAVTVTSPSPVTLVTYAWGFPYSFEGIASVTLAGEAAGMERAYLESWMIQALGFGTLDELWEQVTMELIMDIQDPDELEKAVTAEVTARLEDSGSMVCALMGLDWEQYRASVLPIPETNSSASPSPSPSVSPEPPASLLPSPSASPEPSASLLPSPSVSPEPPASLSPSPSASPEPPASPSPSPSASPEPPVSPSVSPSPSAEPSPQPTAEKTQENGGKAQ